MALVFNRKIGGHMKKLKNFKILINYLKEDWFKVLLYIFLVLISYVPALTAAFFWGKAIEHMLSKELSLFLFYLLLWEGIYIFCFSFLAYFRDRLYNYLEMKFVRRVSMDMYKKIDKLPAIAFEDIGVGEFINRLHSDTDRVMSLLKDMIRLICKSIVVIVILVLAFKISTLMGCTILLFALIMGFVSNFFFPKIKKTQEKIKEQSDLYVKKATENITGIREIKALGISDVIEDNVSGTLETLFVNEKRIRGYETLYYCINNFLYFALNFAIIYVAGCYVMNGMITYAIFVTLDSYIWRIDEIVESLSDFGVNFNKVSVSLKRIDEIVNNKLYPDEAYGKKAIKNPKGLIEFKNVKFKYREDEDFTLKGLDLVLKPNKKNAIVGRSGNGKSTLFNLLLRYFDATEGEILIDGINIKDLSEKSLRKNISIIRQAPFLFNLSIMDNFRYIKKNVTLDEVRAVCKKAYIDDYIMSLPNGYETIIGEGGVNLSGGQKQRIAIARTLLLDTKIILFDEATSALDNESQDYIKKTIDSLVKDHTIVIVAHRLSTILDADVINIINKGKLEASGTHKELLKNSKVYQKLYLNESSN